MEIVFLIAICAVIILSVKIRSQHWRQRKVIETITQTMTFEQARYLTPADTAHLFNETMEQYQIGAQKKKCYQQVVSVLATEYEAQLRAGDYPNKYDELAHLHKLLQVGIDDQHGQRTFAMLFMKIRYYTQ